MQRFLWIGFATVLVAAVSVAGESAKAVAPATDLAAYLAQAAKLGFQRAPAQAEGPFMPTEADRARGYALFTRNVNQRLYPESVPLAGEQGDALYAFGAPGETVSAQTALRTLAPLTGVRVTATALRGPNGAAIAADRVRVRWLEYAPTQGGGRRAFGRGAAATAPVRQCIVLPLRIRSLPAAGLDLPANWTQGWWFTLSIPASQAPGRYEGRIEYRHGDQPPVQFPLVLTVLPIQLGDVRSMFFGAFLMLHGGPDSPLVHNVAQLKDLADRNIHGLLWFWGHYGLTVRRVDDQLKLDFGNLDAYMERVKEAGIKGPIALALGNDSRGHLEQAIGELWDLPLRRHTDNPQTGADRLFCVATTDSPQMDALYVEAIRQLLDHAKAKGWPEIVFLPYDEPSERLQAEYVHRAGLLKKHFPQTRIYGVVMGRVNDLSWIASVSDILVTNGGATQVRDYAKEHGKEFWTYGGQCHASATYGQARLDYGPRPWGIRTQGQWFWAYNWYVGDPMNEFDGRNADAGWAAAYPPEKPGEACVPSPAFEGMRAGVDDVRYAQALEALLDRLPKETAQPYRDRLERLRQGLSGVRRGPAATAPAVPPAPAPAAVAVKPAFPTGPLAGEDAFRLQVIEMIQAVQK
jgi:hypothetical protein